MPARVEQVRHFNHLYPTAMLPVAAPVGCMGRPIPFHPLMGMPADHAVPPG